MGEGNIFTFCVNPHLVGGWGGGGRRTPSQVWTRGGTPTRSGWLGGTLARYGWWGVPQPGLDGGGGVPIQVWMVGGYPPLPGLDGGGGGTPPGQVWMVGRYPPPTPIRQSSIASTCYPTGGMPLAFTQEDFLVEKLLPQLLNLKADFRL